MKRFAEHRPAPVLAAAALGCVLIGGLFLAGCDSDPVTPNDNLPAVTEAGAASQAGAVAAAASAVVPEIVKFDGGKQTYDFTFFGDISGTVWMDFFLAGSPSAWDVADAANLYTEDGEVITMAIGLGGEITVALDVTADIDRGANTAVVGGGGVFTSGENTGSFTFTELAVSATAGYPTDGSMTFTGAGFEMLVEFDGGGTAVISVDGAASYTVDLDTGETTEI
jgi:hypothetical protein